MGDVILHGITWGHSRGITPLLALSQRYSELNPGIEIRWKKRTLQEFADFPIEQLTKEYDLLIIDHPWVGCAHATRCVLPLEQHLSPEYLTDQEKNSVGGSHQSYQYNGSQWALATDAATPAASFRKDLFDLHQAVIPQTWNELIALAKKGKVAVPAIPIDLLMNFYSFCIACGEIPFTSHEQIVSLSIAHEAIDKMKELYSLLPPQMFWYNPIKVAELMSNTNDFWYCPFAYAYSNYSREGYASRILTYGDVVEINGEKLRTTIGGTGLAVSAFSANQEVALDFASNAVSGKWQRTMYVQHGGQPGHLSAWTDEEANRLTNNFFKNVLPVMQHGFIRPRYHGYLFFQDHAGEPLQRCIQNQKSINDTIYEMNSLYRQSFFSNKPIAFV
jgi:multiple sugar transport system substrate-binding protein